MEEIEIMSWLTLDERKEEDGEAPFEEEDREYDEEEEDEEEVLKVEDDSDSY